MVCVGVSGAAVRVRHKLDVGGEVKPDITMTSLMRSMTLHVRIDMPRRWRVRAWLAKRLLWLACWVLGCGIEIEER